MYTMTFSVDLSCTYGNICRTLRVCCSYLIRCRVAVTVSECTLVLFPPTVLHNKGCVCRAFPEIELCGQLPMLVCVGGVANTKRLVNCYQFQPLISD